jgi:hypothetical protein
MLLCFYLFLFLFLMLYVSFYDLFVDSNRADKIATSPKMITPVWLLLHFRVALEQLYCKLALQDTHHLRNRNLGRYRQYKMDVVILNTHLFKLTMFPVTQHPDVRFYQLLDLPSQNPKSIFGNPYNVIITLINNMRQLLVLAHVTKIGIAVKTLPPSKTVGF